MIAGTWHAYSRHGTQTTATHMLNLHSRPRICVLQCPQKACAPWCEGTAEGEGERQPQGWVTTRFISGMPLVI